jgi:hypothetical protein
MKMNLKNFGSAAFIAALCLMNNAAAFAAKSEEEGDVLSRADVESIVSSEITNQMPTINEKVKTAVADASSDWLLWVCIMLIFLLMAAVAWLFIKNSSLEDRSLAKDKKERDSIKEERKSIKKDLSSIKSINENLTEVKDYLKKENFAGKIEKLEKELSYMELQLKELQETQSRKESDSSNWSKSSLRQSATSRPNTPPPAKPSITPEQKAKMDKFVAAYNELRQAEKNGAWRTKRNELQEKYAVKSFSCVNYDERMADQSIPPDYKTESQGNFLAVAAYPEKGVYYAVPSLTLQYSDQIHWTGGMKEAFDSNYQDKTQYSNLKVTKSALFMLSGDKWTIVQKGKLELLP